MTRPRERRAVIIARREAEARARARAAEDAILRELRLMAREIRAARAALARR